VPDLRSLGPNDVESTAEGGHPPVGGDPSGDAPLRVRWWSPLPPTPGVLPAQAAIEVGALIGFSPGAVEWSAVVGARPNEAIVPAGLAVQAARAIRPDGDRRALDIYHLGRDERTYGFLVPSLLERPGLVVLHDDLALEDFDPGRLGALALEAAGAVVVRSSRLAAALAERWPTRRIVPVPYWLPSLPELAREGIVGSERSKGGGVSGGDDPSRPGRFVVVGVVGCLDHSDGPTVVAEALLSLPADLRQRVRIRLTGTVRSVAWLEALRARLSAGGCGDALEVTLGATGVELLRALQTCDVVLSLPPHGASGPGPVATWAQSFGLPVVVPETAGEADPDGPYWPLPSGPCDIQAAVLAARLRELLSGGGEGRPDERFDREAWVAAGDAAARRFLAVCRDLADEEVSGSAAARRSTTGVVPVPRRPRPLRVRAICDFALGNGLSEAARRLSAAIEAAGIEVRREQVRVFPGPTEVGHGVVSQPASFDCDVTLCFVNVSEMIGLSEEILRPSGRQSYVIGSWYGELPALASAHRASVGRVDEVWVATRYVG